MDFELLQVIQYRFYLLPRPFNLTLDETQFIDQEIITLLSKQVLKEVSSYIHEQWILNIFLQPKNNGKFRMILDLTLLNKLIEYEHFKMFNLSTALALVEKGVWMASGDLTDAYYSGPINEDH